MENETIEIGYTNPVYAGYMADPFVWRHNADYYAVGTGPAEAAGEIADAEQAASAMLGRFRIFPLLQSDDLVNWRHTLGALTPPDPALGDTYWAPEAAYNNGEFYLYFSVGRADKQHQLRVALSNHPAGPSEDSGKALVDPGKNPFAIDAHPFKDDDGQWYLFYATDFLDVSDSARPGTALVVDRMVNMTTLAGEPRTVARAQHDWQRFQSNREMYGELWDWHTLEGPSVVKHDGRYYCFFSGGRWDSDRYGVDYCTADNPLGPWESSGSADGPRVLKSVPGEVLGPGHNSVVLGPDNQTQFLVYHAWDPLHTSRQMFIDPLIWTPNGPRCYGPTHIPQTIRSAVSRQDRL